MVDAKLIIKPPHMEVRMKPGSWPDLAKMQRTIRDAGYKVGDAGVELRLTGKVVKQGDGLALELDGMKTPVTVPLVAAGKGDPGLPARLSEQEGKTVEVTGRWQAGADAGSPGSLSVTSLGGPGETGGK